MIVYDKKIKRFRQDGRIVSKSKGLKSSIARKQYLASLKRRVKKKKSVQPTTEKYFELEDVHEQFEHSANILKDSNLKLWERPSYDYDDEEIDIYSTSITENLGSYRKKLRRQYPKSLSNKLIYKKSSDLRRKTRSVFVHYLVHNPETGYTVMPLHVRIAKKDAKTVKQWERHLQDMNKYKKASQGFQRTLVNNILPAYSNQIGHDMVFKDVIAWSLNDIRQDNSRKISKKHKAKRTRK